MNRYEYSPKTKPERFFCHIKIGDEVKFLASKLEARHQSGYLDIAELKFALAARGKVITVEMGQYQRRKRMLATIDWGNKVSRHFVFSLERL